MAQVGKTSMGEKARSLLGDLKGLRAEKGIFEEEAEKISPRIKSWKGKEAEAAIRPIQGGMGGSCSSGDTDVPAVPGALSFWVPSLERLRQSFAGRNTTGP